MIVCKLILVLNVEDEMTRHECDLLFKQGHTCTCTCTVCSGQIRCSLNYTVQ